MDASEASAAKAGIAAPVGKATVAETRAATITESTETATKPAEAAPTKSAEAPAERRSLIQHGKAEGNSRAYQ